MSNCSEDFRDVWWQIDPAVTDAMKPALNSLSFKMGSDGLLEITTYDRSWDHIYEWECVNYGNESLNVSSEDLDYYHILNQGSALLKRLEGEDSWMMYLNFKNGIIKEEAEIWLSDWGLE